MISHPLFRQILKVLSASLIVCIFAWGSSHAGANTVIYKFASPEQEKLFYELATELRCPQCQNNNIAESNAGLSADMREKVYELLQEGYSKTEVVDFMKAGYGDFITYDPPFTAATSIMWVAPILALLIGGGYIVIRARRKTKLSAETATALEVETTAKQKTKQSDAVVATDEVPPTSSPLFFVWAGLLLAIVTGGGFYFTQNWTELQLKKEAIESYEFIKPRLATGDITVKELEKLAIGLRHDLDVNPDNAQNWYLMGYMYENFMQVPQFAKHAYARAYALTPNDLQIQSAYAQSVMRNSANPKDQVFAAGILRKVVATNPNDHYATYWLASYYQLNKQYMQSISLWERLLPNLPEGTFADTVKSKLEEDKAKFGTVAQSKTK